MAAEIVRVDHDLPGIVDAEALVAVQLFEPFAEGGQFDGIGRVDDGDLVLVQVDALAPGDALDGVAVAEQDGRAELAGGELGGGVLRARFGSLGEDDALGVAREFFENGVDELHPAGSLDGIGRVESARCAPARSTAT